MPDLSMSDIQRCVAGLRTFSPAHATYLETIFKDILEYYGDRLAGLAVFGSYARQENTKNSDLDLLIILKGTSQRRERIIEFVNEIEMRHETLAQQLYTNEGISVELSPYLLTESEALKLQPIYFDLVEHLHVIHDPYGLIARIVQSTSRLLKEKGARRRRRNNTWEWQTAHFLGGIDL